MKFIELSRTPGDAEYVGHVWTEDSSLSFEPSTPGELEEFLTANEGRELIVVPANGSALSLVWDRLAAAVEAASDPVVCVVLDPLSPLPAGQFLWLSPDASPSPRLDDLVEDWYLSVDAAVAGALLGAASAVVLPPSLTELVRDPALSDEALVLCLEDRSDDELRLALAGAPLPTAVTDAPLPTAVTDAPAPDPLAEARGALLALSGPDHSPLTVQTGYAVVTYALAHPLWGNEFVELSSYARVTELQALASASIVWAYSFALLGCPVSTAFAMPLDSRRLAATYEAGVVTLENEDYYFRFPLLGDLAPAPLPGEWVQRALGAAK